VFGAYLPITADLTCQAVPPDRRSFARPSRNRRRRRDVLPTAWDASPDIRSSDGSRSAARINGEPCRWSPGMACYRHSTLRSLMDVRRACPIYCSASSTYRTCCSVCGHRGHRRLLGSRRQEACSIFNALGGVCPWRTRCSAKIVPVRPIPLRQCT
jgi:hypothetical protein